MDFYMVAVELSSCPQTDWFGEDKRNHPRFALAVEVGLARLPLLESSEALHWCSGTTENASRGGMAVLSNQTFPPDTLLRCEIAIPGSSVFIPTLMKVRWSDRSEGPTNYRLGLQFLV